MRSRRFLYLQRWALAFSLSFSTLALPSQQASAAIATNSSTVSNLSSGVAGLSGSNFRDIATNPTGEKVVAVVDLGDIFLSSDSGTTWTNLTTGTAQSGLAWRSVAISADGQVIFAAVYGGDIYKSSDAGASWSSTTLTTGHNLNWSSIAISDDAVNIFAAATGNYIYISKNSGATWVVQRPLPPGYSDIARNYSTISTTSDGQRFVTGPGFASVLSSLTPDTTTAIFMGSSFVIADLAMSRDGSRIYSLASSGAYLFSTWSRIPGISGYAQQASMYCYSNGCPAGQVIGTNADGRVAAYGGSATKLILSVNSGTSYATLTNSPTADWRGVAFTADGASFYAVAYGGDIFKVNVDISTAQFTLIYHPDGGSGSCGSTYLASASMALLGTSGCTRAGYTLQGWRINGADYAPGETITVNSQINAEAIWSASYTITYSGNVQSSGSVPVATTGSAGSTITLAANTGNLTKSNYAFNGWNTLSNGLGVNYQAGSAYQLTSSLTLYAQWSTDVSTPVTLASVVNPNAYRFTLALQATVVQPGKITFYANGKRIPGCISKTITSTYTCNWRPNVHGGIVLAARLRATNTAYAISESNPVNVGVSARSSLR